MSFLSTLLILLSSAFVANLVGAYILPFAGFFGALCSGIPGERSKARFYIGSIICALGQSYVYMAYIAFVILLIKSSTAIGILLGILWVIGLLTSIIPIWWLMGRASVTHKENPKISGYASPQVEGMQYTFFLSFISFFIMAFIPSVINTIWGWVPSL